MEHSVPLKKSPFKLTAVVDALEEYLSNRRRASDRRCNGSRYLAICPCPLAVTAEVPDASGKTLPYAQGLNFAESAVGRGVGY